MQTEQITACPDRDSLAAFLAGRLSEQAGRPLEAHLLECEACAAAAETLSVKDDLTAALHESRPVADPPALSEAVRRAAELVPEDTVPPEETIVSEPEIQPVAKAGKDETPIDFLAPAEEADEIGRLGHYRVLEVLGAGGMGIVFRAEDPKLQRQVALKVMKPNMAAIDSAKDRFLREARATAALEHDNIVTIFQVDEDRGIPFLAMRFLRGESLHSRLSREKSLPAAETLRIAREVASGLDAAHQQGLIHRDIKPDNLFLEEGTGRVKILDFGLARVNDDDTHLTQSGMLLGTPKYMAPEQTTGEDIDERADLFSLGSVVYHMAAGQAPFAGKNVTATLVAVAHQDPEPIEQVNPMTHPLVALLTRKLLEKDPAARPPSAKAVVAGIRKIEKRIASGRGTDPTLAIPQLDTQTSHERREMHRRPRHKTRRRSADSQETQTLSKKNSGLWIAVSTLCLLFAFGGGYLLYGILFKVKTSDGTLVIEVDDPKNVVVEIDGREAKVQRKDGKFITIALEAGTKKLVVKTTDGTILKTSVGEKIEIAAGEKVSVRAWVEPVVVPKKDRDRLAAEWAIALGGKVRINDPPQGWKLYQFPGGFRAWLPGEPAKVTKKTDKNRTLLDADFRDDKAGIHYILSYVDNAPTIHEDPDKALDIVCDSVVRRVKGRTTRDEPLKMKGAIGREIEIATGEGKSTGRTRFWISGKHLYQLIAHAEPGRERHRDIDTFLRSFQPDETKAGAVSDAKTLPDVPFRVTQIDLRDKRDVTDESLANLNRCKGLFHIDLRGTRVTETGVRNLSAAHRDCLIVWDGGTRIAARMPPLEKPAPSYALQFDGKDDYVSIPTLKGPAKTPTTIEAWVTVQKRGEGVPMLIEMGGLKMRLHQTRTAQWMFIGFGNRDPVLLAVPAAAEMDKLIHIAGVWQKGGLRLFINGRVVAQRPIRPGFLLKGQKQHASIGGWGAEDAAAAFRGRIHQFHVADKVLYTKSFSPRRRFRKAPESRVLYRFEEAAGSKLVDACNKHHGVIHGATWVNADGSTIDYDRLIAEWSLRNNTPLGIISGGKKLFVKSVDELPKAPFKVHELQSGVNWKSISAIDIERISKLDALENLRLTPVPVGDQGAKLLSRMTSLKRLQLGSGRITDAGVKHLAALKNIEVLNLQQNQISDDGLKPLLALPKLRSLLLENNSRITQKGITTLEGGLPLCRITWGEKKFNDREAAEWVLSVGGTVRVNGRGPDLQKREQLPKEAFQLTSIALRGIKTIEDRDLARFRNCVHLKKLFLYGTQIGNAGVAHFNAATELEDLDLHSTRVTNEGLAHFSACRNLKTLDISRCPITDAGLGQLSLGESLTYANLIATQVTDDGLKHFAQCANLQRLYLSGAGIKGRGLTHVVSKNLTDLFLDATSVTDEAMAALSGTQIQSLSLRRTPIGDKGLKHLHQCPKLATIHLAETKVTKAGVAAFRKAVPACLVDWGGPVESDREAAVLVHNLGGGVKVRIGPDLVSVGPKDKLPDGEMTLEFIDLAHKKNLSMGDMRRLSGCRAVKTLFLAHTGITDVDIRELKGWTALEFLDLSHCRTATEIISLRQCTKLSQLRLEGNHFADFHIHVLVPFKSLTYLNLKQTKITAEGVAKINLIHPKCRVDSDFDAKDIAAAKKTLVRRSREAAEWVLKSGGRVAVDHATQGKLEIPNGGKLPAGEFALTEANLDNAKFDVAGLKKLNGIPTLLTLSLQNTTTNDAAFDALADLPNLHELHASGTQLTNASLNQLTRFKLLTALKIARTAVNADGIKRLGHWPDLKELVIDLPDFGDREIQTLKHLTRLEELSLTNSQITNNGLVYLEPLTKLRFLNITRTNIDDAGLKRLEKLPGLRDLRVDATKVSGRGIAAFMVARPNCRVYGKRCEMTQQQLAAWVLARRGRIRGRVGKNFSVPIGAAKDIPAGDFAVTSVDFSAGGDIHNYALDVLLNANELEWLGVANTQVTDYGLELFVARMPKLSSLALSSPKVTERGIAALSKVKSLTSLTLFGDISEKHLAAVGKLRELPSFHGLSIRGRTSTKALRALSGLKLTALTIQCPNTGNDALEVLGSMEALDHLALEKLPVTDEALKQLHKLKSLRTLRLKGTKVTQTGVTAIEQALPKLKVELIK